MPDVATSLVMYVNRALFEAAGTPLPGRSGPGRTTSPPPSASPTPAGRTALRRGGLQRQLPPLTVLWQNGADILNKDRTALTIDQPGAVEALTWIADQLTSPASTPPPADMAGKTAQEFFLDGKAAMLPTSRPHGQHRPGRPVRGGDRAPPPGQAALTRTACGGTAMTPWRKNPDGRVAFLRFLAGEEFQWLMARAGGIIFPAHKKVAESPDLFAGGPFPRSPRVTVDAMAYARVEPYVPRYVDLKAAYSQGDRHRLDRRASVRDALTRARAAIGADGLQDSLAGGPSARR